MELGVSDEKLPALCLGMIIRAQMCWQEGQQCWEMKN